MTLSPAEIRQLPARVRLASKLKKLRAAQGISQDIVRKTLKYKSSQFVSNWERGVVGIPAEVIPAISKLYKVKPNILANMLVEEYRERVMKTIERQRMIGKRK